MMLEDIIGAALVSNEHCLILPHEGLNAGLAKDLLDKYATELDTSPAIITCTPETTLDDLNGAITVGRADGDGGRSRIESITFQSIRRNEPVRLDSSKDSNPAEASTDLDLRIADVVIAIDLDLAIIDIQLQALELLRSRRIFTRDSMLIAPKHFLLIATVSAPHARLYRHLNDLFAVSCFLDPHSSINPPAFTLKELDTYRTQATQVNLTAEVDAYLHNIALAMRLSRYVQAGVTAASTKHLRLTSKALAAVQGLDFVTPSFAIQAARMVYPHRLELATAETERTLQWGSAPEAVEQILKNISIEGVIEDAIASVPTPL